MQLSLDMSAIHCSFLFPEQKTKPNNDAQTGTRVANAAHMLQGLSACEAALEEKGRWQQLPDSTDQFGSYVLLTDPSTTSQLEFTTHRRE
jgi:hypothetical protein